MNKYEPHNYDANIQPSTLHDMIADLKNQVNGLLDDSRKDQREIELLRDSVGNKYATEDGFKSISGGLYFVAFIISLTALGIVVAITLN